MGKPRKTRRKLMERQGGQKKDSLLMSDGVLPHKVRLGVGSKQKSKASSGQWGPWKERKSHQKIFGQAVSKPLRGNEK